MGVVIIIIIIINERTLIVVIVLLKRSLLAFKVADLHGWWLINYSDRSALLFISDHFGHPRPNLIIILSITPSACTAIEK